MSVAVKICGLQDGAALHAATEGGARYVGFVFCAPSRHRIGPEQARELATQVSTGVRTVGLFVDPSDEEIDNIITRVPLNILQLHGHETPQRVQEIRRRTGLQIMKVFHIAAIEDFVAVPAYNACADLFLFDTKLGPTPTGGTGKSFNWNLLKGHRFAKPWMLAGGLNITNLAEAVTTSGARIVDLSSGVETDGHKDPQKICDLLALAATL